VLASDLVRGASTTNSHHRDFRIWVVADDLGLLRQLDAARLNG
jgi:hypothetical protein